MIIVSIEFLDFHINEGSRIERQGNCANYTFQSIMKNNTKCDFKELSWIKEYKVTKHKINKKSYEKKINKNLKIILQTL